MAKHVMKFLIGLYAKAVSPFLGDNCRFHPTCSLYAMEAIDRFGAIKGGFLAAKRILKCHPYYKGDMIDPVPMNVDREGPIGYKRAIHKTSEQKD